MGRVVIACYRPKPGREDDLLALLRDHLPILRGEGLATERDPIVARAADATIVEVFEWRSRAAVEEAHENAVVRAMWDRFGAVCTYVRYGDLAEAGVLFPNFDSVDL